MASFFGIVQADLENRLSIASVLGLYDDGNGTVNATALAAVIVNAEQETLSWLVDEQGNVPSMPSDLQTDPFFKGCALDFAIAYSIERRPEYAKQAGLGTKESYFARASKRMERVLDGRQRATQMAERPANVGGMVNDNSNRIIVDNADGTQNSGDY